MLSKDKIQALLDYFQIKSVKQLEIRLGLSNGYISNLQKKGTDNPGRMLVALNENGISADWFFSSSEIMTLNDRLNIQPYNAKVLHKEVEYTTNKTKGIPLIFDGDKEFEDGIVIPVLGDNPVSAGHGEGVGDDEIPTRYIRVPRDLAKYPHLVSLPVRGDSMSPTLSDGDMVVCDGGGWDGDGIYVIKTIDETFVKRVQLTSSGYRIVSDNKLYESYTENSEGIGIVGRVRAMFVMVPGKRGGV